MIGSFKLATATEVPNTWSSIIPKSTCDKNRFYAVSIRRSSMGHRQLVFPSQTSDMGCEHNWNHPYPDPHLRLGTPAVGVNPLPYFDITLRPNNILSSNFSLEIPNHSRRINPGINDTFPHPSSASSFNPPNYFQGGPSCYDGFAINSHMDYGRAPYKRKAIPMAVDRGNNSSYHSAGSSSSLSFPSVANTASGPQYLAWDPNGMPSSYRNNNLLTVGEGSRRNVRSRQSRAIHLGNNQTGTGAHQPINLPHHLHPTSNNTPGLPAAAQWVYAPASFGYNRRILSSGVGSFSHEMNQSFAANNTTNSNIEIDGGYCHNLLHNRINSTPLPTPHVPSLQVVGAGHSIYDQRTHPYRATSGYQPVGFEAPLVDRRRQGIEVVPPPRHSRPLSIIGRSNERSGRSRGLYDRFQPFSYGNNTNSGWVSEQRTFYDSRNLFDQHHDMRLDIDNMSYEELLALEERIGNVSTGLSGDNFSSCLVETVYTSNQIQDNQEEMSCVICLEEYKDGENVGQLGCGHEFHSKCIKKWLLIKNACPMCKASADPCKEK